MKTEDLKKLWLFSELPVREMEHIFEISKKRHYPRGSIVIYQGDKAEFLYLILKGRIKVTLCHPNGKEVILNTLKEGDYFGEVSVFDQQPHSATIMTETDSEFLAISRETFKEMIMKYPEISLKMLKEMSMRLRAANELIGSLTHLDVKKRVAKTLLNLSRSIGEKGSDASIQIPRPTLYDIASMSGTSRETVSRILSMLAKEGLLILTKEDIIICHQNKIVHMAEDTD
ncbi:MAG: Crp/Fnr family transcriptional regulator [Deltaproteobacteria bacterium]|nr:Crp/Fnr family transcriptional regulator [Deltaproteobacteria bacterium]